MAGQFAIKSKSKTRNRLIMKQLSQNETIRKFRQRVWTKTTKKYRCFKYSSKKILIGTWIAILFISQRVLVPKRSNPIRLRASRWLFSTDHYTKRDLRTDLSAVSRLFLRPWENFLFGNYSIRWNQSSVFAGNYEQPRATPNIKAM